jgi:hypothetical protein
LYYTHTCCTFENSPLDMHICGVGDNFYCWEFREGFGLFSNCSLSPWESVVSQTNIC